MEKNVDALINRIREFLSLDLSDKKSDPKALWRTSGKMEFELKMHRNKLLANILEAEELLESLKRRADLLKEKISIKRKRKPNPGSEAFALCEIKKKKKMDGQGTRTGEILEEKSKRTTGEQQLPHHELTLELASATDSTNSGTGASLLNVRNQENIILSEDERKGNSDSSSAPAKTPAVNTADPLKNFVLPLSVTSNKSSVRVEVTRTNGHLISFNRDFTSEETRKATVQSISTDRGNGTNSLLRAPLASEASRHTEEVGSIQTGTGIGNTSQSDRPEKPFKAIENSSLAVTEKIGGKKSPLIIDLGSDEEGTIIPSAERLPKLRHFLLPHEDKEAWEKKILPLLVKLQTLKTLDEFFETIKEIIRINEGADVKLVYLTGLMNSISSNEKSFFLQTLLPFISKLAIEISKLFANRLRVLQAGEIGKLTLKKRQVACLLANMFLCTVANKEEGAAEGKFNFSFIFGRQEETENKTSIQKIAFIYNYFRKICTKEIQSHVLIYQRLPIKQETFWSCSNTPLTSVKILRDERFNLERPSIYLTYAHRKMRDPVSQAVSLATDVLSTGWSKNHIFYFTNPELIISKLVMEDVGTNDAIRVFGCEQFSLCKGNGERLIYEISNKDDAPIDELNKKSNVIVELNLKNLSIDNPFEEFQNLNLDLVSACLALRDDSSLFGKQRHTVVSGVWGNRALDFNPQLKFMIEWLAASEMNRKMVFFANDSNKNMEKLEEVVKHVRISKTVKQLYEDIIRYPTNCCKEGKTLSLFEYLMI